MEKQCQQAATKSRFKRVCVFCGSSPGKNPSYQLAALQLANQLVERKIDLVYGGGSIGLMGLVSKAVYNGGRHVLGVIPKALMPKEIVGETIGEVRSVSSMHQRKAEMARQADAFIALPGGYGTLEELLEVITWSQLGIHEKPVGLLNVDGYYNSLLSFIDKAVEEGFITPAARSIIVSAHTVHDLMSKLEEYKMIGSFITRGLVMIFGYAYPAYECFKTVEKNKPEVEQLRFWCQYWILVAVLTVCERIGDTFISWVPMYSEAKLAFYVYLWYPKTKGTSYVYDSFFRPYVSKHETEIDRNLLELRTRAGDIVVLYWQKAASYGQTRIFEILHYVAAQSTPRPRPTQPQQEAARTRRPAAVSNRQTSARAQQQNEEPSSPTSSTSLSQQEGDEEEEPSSPVAPSTEAPPAAVLNVLKKMGPQPASRSSSPSALKKTAHVPGSPNSSALKKTASAPDGSVQPTTEKTALKKTASASEGSIQPTTMEAEDMQIGTVPPSTERENPPSPPQETVMEEAIRVTRGRLRKTRSTAK